MTDPFTLDVVAAGLDAAATEMFDGLRKTAMSPIIYEVLDVGTGITDADGALISSGAGIPSFVGVLDKSISAIIDVHNDIAAGDVFVTNDPNAGGVTHLNDVVIAQPVFHDNQRIAWVASIAHWGDVGGATPGSMSTRTEDIAAEGLRLPCVRLVSKGRHNSAVFDIIRVNSRLPDHVNGDLWAQVSAGQRAAELVSRLCERYGITVFKQAIEDARRLGTRRALAGLASLPCGEYRIAEPQDDGSSWRATITINNERFIVDLRDAPAQSMGPYNTSRDGAVVACQVLFKALTDPGRFANAGSFAPLEVLTEPGTIFHAGPTAAHAYYFETRIRLIDMLWHCLAKALPDRLPAGHFASIFGTVIAGRHPDTQQSFAMVEPQMGGWGATAQRRGEHAMFSTNHGDTFNCPAEVAEARYGIEVIEKSLALAPEVSGEHAGGAGLCVRYGLRADAVLSTGCSHAKVPAWSLNDASTGGTNSLTVLTEKGERREHHIASGVRLHKGDIVKIVTAFGGAAKAS